MDSPDQEPSAVLFPDSYASESEIAKILSFFEGVTIFRPWYMESPIAIPGEYGSVKVLRPREELKPAEGFHSLLSEYKSWMKQSPGYIPASLNVYGKGEEPTWDIRKALRSGDQNRRAVDADATQWHLLLHLAMETEERLEEAEKALSALKSRGSPLQGVVGEGEPKDPLDDLPRFHFGSEIGEEFIERVLEAWYGLFQEFLDENALLVTTKPHVMTFLSGLWEEFCSPGGAPEYGFRFEWPFFSNGRPVWLNQETESIPDWALWKELRRLTAGIGQDPAMRPDRIRELLQGLTRSRTYLKRERMLVFTVKFFSPCSEGGGGRRRNILRNLSGKTLFLLQEESDGE